MLNEFHNEIGGNRKKEENIVADSPDHLLFMPGMVPI